MKKIILFFATMTVIILAIIIAKNISPSPSPPPEKIADQTSSVAINGHTIWVTLADEPSEWEKGLSGRARLTENEGLLFIFPVALQPGFWMKEMNFPLDLVWINAEKNITDLTLNLATSTYPQTFFPARPIKYVLEVNAGTAQKFGWRVNQRITLVLKGNP